MLVMCFVKQGTGIFCVKFRLYLHRRRLYLHKRIYIGVGVLHRLGLSSVGYMVH